jgi:hypothetical protein
LLLLLKVGVPYTTLNFACGGRTERELAGHLHHLPH